MSPAAVAAALGTPLAVAALLAARPLASAGVRLAPLAALPALALALAAGEAPARLPWLLGGATLGFDATGRLALLGSAVAWTLVLASAVAELADDPRRRRFLGLALVAAAGNLAATVALDATTFYLGFAVMTFAAWGLVVHRPDAAQAGRVYLALAVPGETLLLGGLVLAGAVATSPDAAAIRDAVAVHPWRGVIVGLVVAGLGTKVGLVPLHVALPVAYAAAPFAATAALASGMLTAALTGLVRFLPLGTASMPDGGFWIAVAGAAGALWGVGVALVQTDVRALVAYSTVTTGGLLCMAIGTGLRDAAAWEAAVGAVVVYAFHNATAKVALLVGLGVAATVGRRARGLVLAGLLLPALALVGVPGTGGAAAKAGLHEALVLLPAPWSGWADLVSGVVAVGTVLVVARGLLLADAAIPEATVPRPLGRVLPWLAALVALAATPALLTLVAPSLVMTSLQADAALAAVKKLAIGLALAGAAVWLRGRPDPTRPAAVPPGDVLGLVAPPVRAAGRALVALAALPDRLTPPALPSPSGRDPEAALRDPAIVGVVVLALAGAVALLLALR